MSLIKVNDIRKLPEYFFMCSSVEDAKQRFPGRKIYEYVTERHNIIAVEAQEDELVRFD